MNATDPAAVITATSAQLAALDAVALGDARRTARVAAAQGRPGAAEALARVEEARHQPGKCADCGDPLAWTTEAGSRRIHAWSGRRGLPELPYGHAAQHAGQHAA